ncbi:hypothetical protein QTP88_010559 [Uroleucon formosanum]
MGRELCLYMSFHVAIQKLLLVLESTATNDVFLSSSFAGVGQQNAVLGGHVWQSNLNAFFVGLSHNMNKDIVLRFLSCGRIMINQIFYSLTLSNQLQYNITVIISDTSFFGIKVRFKL